MTRAARTRRPGPRGYTGPGGGQMTFLQPPITYRATTRQACGLYPYAVPSSAPGIGIPLGPHLESGVRVAGDPMSWYMEARLLSNPSMFLESIPGIGKTSLATHIAVGLAALDIKPMVMADIRPDYIPMTRALGGQVISLGSGVGHLNPLDLGIAPWAAAQLPQLERDEVLEDAAARRRTRVETLVKLSRRADPSDRERNIIERALSVLDERFTGTPLLSDLLQVVRDAPDAVRAVALDRGEISRYRTITEDLEATLIGLASGSRFGDMFSKHTSEPMQLDRAVNFDVSRLRRSDEDTQAAAMTMCWSYGYANIGAAQILADAGVIPRTHYFCINDEFHRALRAGGGGMVEIQDQVSRLNREDGTGQAWITHTMSDLLALPREEDRQKAIGFVERSGMVALGGLPPREMKMLDEVVPLTRREQNMVTSWSTPGGWNSDLGRQAPPPGRGNFLLKVGRNPGVPFNLDLHPDEIALSVSARRWETER